MSTFARLFRFVPVLSFMALTILLTLATAPNRDGDLTLLGESKGPESFDEPDVTHEFYRLKRAPLGKGAIPVQRYLTAAEHIKHMPIHFPGQHSFSPPGQAASGPGGDEVGTMSLGSWTPLGPGNIGGRTRALVIDPHPDPTNGNLTMCAGGVAGGVFKTTNTGATWTPIGDLLPNLAVNSMAMDPTNSNILYAGTGEGYFNPDAVRGAGIFKSTDGGIHWTPPLPGTATSDFYYVNDIVISRNNNIYAATRADRPSAPGGGVWRSRDGGTTWERVLNVTTNGGCLDLAIRTDQPTDWLFASVGTFTQATIYRNTDAGGTGSWTAVYNSDPGLGRTSLAIAPSSQNIIYALGSSIGGDLRAVLKSTDSGTSWITTVSGPFSQSILNTTLLSNTYYPSCSAAYPPNHQGWYDNVIAVDPVNADRVWAGGIDLFRSDNGGSNWGLVSYWWAPTSQPNFYHYAHADQHVIAFHPQYNGGSNTTMFVGNDGGIFRTDTALATTGVLCNNNSTGTLWGSLNNTYGVTQFYHGVPYPNGTTYFGGTQDNGTVRGSDIAGPNGWSVIDGGDGGFVAIDPTNTNILYAENLSLTFKKSFDGGANWNIATTGITGPAATGFLAITPFKMDPNNSQRLWIGGNAMWRTTNAAASWSQASMPFDTNESVSAIAVGPTNPDQVLVGGRRGHVYGTNAGTTSTASTLWSSVVVRNLDDYVSWVAIDPRTPTVVYATIASFNNNPVTDHHIYKSTDGGNSFPISIDGLGTASIPDIPVHCIVVDPNNSSTLYIGTDLGVYVTLDGGSTWGRENTGFANAPTESLAFNPAGTTLFAFTHGRGVWRVFTSVPPPQQPGNNALLLNGSTAYVDVPSSTTLDVTAAITVEAWVNTNTVTAQQSIVERYSSTGGGFALRLDGQNRVQFFSLANAFSGSVVQGASAIPTNGWHHVAGVFDSNGNQLRIYVDGRQDAFTTGTAPAAGNNSLKIGGRGDDASFKFWGLIDEARVTASAVYSANFTTQTCLSSIAGTRGLWKFDNQTAADSSGNNNNGTLQGGAGFAGSQSCGAASSLSLSLNGSTAYVDVPSSTTLDVTAAITVEAWINTNTVTAQQSLVERYSSTGGGFALRLDGQNRVQFFTLANAFSGSVVQGVSAVPTNGWHHVAGVFDGNQLRIYVDGRQDAFTTGTAPAVGNNSLKIGGRGDDASFKFSGFIDEARVTASAVYSVNFTLQTCLSSIAGTRGLWKFDDQTAADSSGNNNNGTLIGGAGFAASQSCGAPSFFSLSLNGPSVTTAYVDVPSSTTLDVTAAITVEAWINTSTSTAAQQSILERYSSTGGGFALRLDGQNRVQFFTLANAFSGSVVQGVSVIPTNGWHHVAGVFDGSQLRIYVDGRQDAFTSGTAPAAGNNSLKIGARGDDASFKFSGLVDEARVTASTVYSANFTPQNHLSAVTGTRGLWKFDDQTAGDSSGNNNNGTLQGGAGFSTSVP